MNPRAPSDEYPDALEAATRGYLSAGWDAGAAALEPIAGQIWTERVARAAVVNPRPGQVVQATEGSRRFTKSLAGTTYRRDGFHCRYCGGRVIPVALMSLLASIYPDHLPFVDTFKRVHPVFWTRGAEADHIVPGARGGSWLDPANHATACVRCNTAKSDHDLADIGWRLLDRTTDGGWDGLTRWYTELWMRSGRPRARYHGDWIRELVA